MAGAVTNRRRCADALGLAVAAYALYWVVGIVDPHVYRVSFLGLTLVLTFLAYPTEGRWRHQDWVWTGLSVATLAWPLTGIDGFVNRAATPLPADLVLGGLAILAVLEATRRATGWVLPATALLFLAYAYAGSVLDRLGLAMVAHRGYGPDRIIGTLYMTLEGLFGVPLDVAATYIVLFTIYGALLEHSGAGRFFVDWTTAALGRRRASGPGRTVAAAGYLLGAVSGSGVANTVMLGAVTWPMMRRAGYPADTGGAVLAAAGIGAILAPPVMGAAAFLIAEFLQVTYLQVIGAAAIPAGLYYLSIFLMVEGDARRLGLQPLDADVAPFRVVTGRGWYHFASLVAIVVLLTQGVTTFRAVGWAMLIAVGLSFMNRATALTPRRLLVALAAGGRSVVPVAATTATAGVIVGVVTLTGLGLKVAGLIVGLAGGQVLLTVLYAAVAVWMLGLAVPVTASYIIAAVMVVPALVQVGVAPVAAHMFVFYYAVLSEVSPPTALSPFAAAALTGGSPLRTTMLSWKYAAPAFVVPLVFAVNPRGLGLLLHAPLADIVLTTTTTALGVVALAASAGGWVGRVLAGYERVLAAAAAVLLFTPRATLHVTGLALLGLLLVRMGRRR